jgi:hypothetical protein
MVIALALLMTMVAAFNPKYLERAENETVRIVRLKKGPLVRLLRDHEALIHRYDRVFNETVIQLETEQEREDGLKRWKEDFPKKYGLTFDSYLIAGEICRARYPEDHVCTTERINWEYFHDFRTKDEKEDFMKLIRGWAKDALKKYKKVDL